MKDHTKALLQQSYCSCDSNIVQKVEKGKEEDTMLDNIVLDSSNSKFLVLIQFALLVVAGQVVVER